MSPSCPWWAVGAWGEVRKRGTAQNLRLGFNPSPFGEEQHTQGGMLGLKFGIGEMEKLALSVAESQSCAGEAKGRLIPALGSPPRLQTQPWAQPQRQQPPQSRALLPLPILWNPACSRGNFPVIPRSPEDGFALDGEAAAGRIIAGLPEWQVGQRAVHLPRASAERRLQLSQATVPSESAFLLKL